MIGWLVVYLGPHAGHSVEAGLQELLAPLLGRYSAQACERPDEGHQLRRPEVGQPGWAFERMQMDEGGIERLAGVQDENTREVYMLVRVWELPSDRGQNRCSQCSSKADL